MALNILIDDILPPLSTNGEIVMSKIERLRKAHYAAAKIVEKLGDEYLIFFERINYELNAAIKENDLKSLAMLIAKQQY